MVTRAWFRCLLAAALFGAATPASKWLLASVGTLTLAGLLYAGAALVTLPHAWQSRRAAVPSRTNVLRLAGAVLFGGVAAPVLLLSGLKLASSSSVSLWLNLEGVATAVVGWALFREQLGPRVWLAVLAALSAGTLLSVIEGAHGGLAAVLVTLACVCWGLDNNLTAVNDGFTPTQTTCIKGAVAAAVNLALGVWLGPALPSIEVAGLALLLGSLAYGASLVLYIAGAQQLGATRSQVLFSTAPFMGLGVSWAALGEPVLPAQLLAGAVMAVGLWLVQHAEHAHPHVHTPLLHSHPHRHDDGHHGHEHPGWAPHLEHSHPHTHTHVEHTHPHVPDLHHRH